MNPALTFYPGKTPLLVSVPHAGTSLPEAIADRLLPATLGLPDTDWYVDRLYRWVRDAGVGMLVANYSRYVVDLNRPPDNSALYSTAGTGLVPQQTFTGEPLYANEDLPDRTDITSRIKAYWQPYHRQLAEALDDIKQRFGFAILLDAHSIRAELPRLFEGRLPDLNLGSYRGASAAPGLIAACYATLNANKELSTVLDGRFQGGYITRHYGQPGNGIHALQLEMVQAVYMNEQPVAWNQSRADEVTPVLRCLVKTLLDWSPPRVQYAD